jgi:hypothetical protein
MLSVGHGFRECARGKRRRSKSIQEGSMVQPLLIDGWIDAGMKWEKTKRYS